LTKFAGRNGIKKDRKKVVSWKILLQASESDLRFCFYDECILQTISVLVQREPKRLDLCGGAFVGEPKEDDSVVCFSASADKLAAVFAFGEHNPVFCMGFREDFNVARTLPFLVDAVNLVTLLSKPV